MRRLLSRVKGKWQCIVKHPKASNNAALFPPHNLKWPGTEQLPRKSIALAKAIAVEENDQTGGEELPLPKHSPAGRVPGNEKPKSLFPCPRLPVAQFNQKPVQDPPDEVPRSHPFGMPNRVQKDGKEILRTIGDYPSHLFVLLTVFHFLGFSLSQCHEIISHLVSVRVIFPTVCTFFL